MRPALPLTRVGATGPANLWLSTVVAIIYCSLSGSVYSAMRLTRFEKSRSNLAAPARSSADICCGWEAGFWVVNARPCCVRAERFAPEQLGYGRIEPSSGAIQSLDRAAFLAGIDPAVPLCIFVHGYGSDFKRGLDDAHFAYLHLLQEVEDQRFQFLLFSWPTELDGSLLLPLPRDVRVKQMRADITAHYLVWLLRHFPPAQPICLIGYSLGARTVASALHLLGGGVGAIPGFTQPPSESRRLHAVFVAAATGHEWFSPGHKFEMAPLAAQQILVLQNPRDPALWLYPLVAWDCARCLGRHGLTRQDRRELGPSAEKIRVISVGRYLGWQHELQAYFRSSTITKLIGSALQFNPAECRQCEGVKHGTK